MMGSCGIYSEVDRFGLAAGISEMAGVEPLRDLADVGFVGGDDHDVGCYFLIRYRREAPLQVFGSGSKGWHHD